MNKCNLCNGVLVDNTPSYVPLGEDTVLEVTDQTCPNCGGVVVGPNQKKKFIKDKGFHDKLVTSLETTLHP